MDLTGFDADKKIKEQRLLKSAKKEK